MTQPTPDDQPKLIGWQSINTAPVNRSVLVRHSSGAGEVYDVAVFVGRQSTGELRWIMSDVRLESRQLTHWHELPEPPEDVE